MKKFLSTLLAATAAFAMTKYVLISFEIDTQCWSLTALAVCTGLITALLMIKESRLPFIFGATGICLLGFMTLIPLLNIEPFWTIFITIVVVAVITRIIVDKSFKFLNVILSIGIAIVSSLLINKIPFELVALPILIGAFSVIILIDVEFRKRVQKAPILTDNNFNNDAQIDVDID